jgi:hypothetical protein
MKTKEEIEKYRDKIQEKFDRLKADMYKYEFGKLSYTTQQQFYRYETELSLLHWILRQ